MSSARKLSDKAIELLNGSVENRIEHINKSIFIPYPRAVDILDEMEDLLDAPKVNRMPNMLVLGRSDNGKTEILREFLRRHPAEDRVELDRAYAPVIYVQSPPGPTEHIFLDKVLMMLGVSVNQNEASDKKLMRVMDLLQGVQTKVLMIDELNALLAGSVTKQRFFLNMIKYISNELRISIVAAGTVEAEIAVGSEKQIQSRFPSRKLPVWKEDKLFKQMLYSFEYVLPLKEGSDIYRGEIASKIYGLSDGTIGGAAKVIRSAAIEAIESGTEKITMDVIRSCKYVTRKEASDDEVI